jgi:RNA polymerase sigma factor (sigma-70 family)
MGAVPTPPPEQTLAQIKAYAGECLGPRAAALMANPKVLPLTLLKIRNGASVEDAVLAEVYSNCTQDSRMADEFLAFFLNDLARLGHGTLSPGLRRFLDTGDLVQSVVGDLWPSLIELEFRGRDSFLALLAARLRWKAADRARVMTADKRREDMRLSISPERNPPSAHTPSPVSELVHEEEWQQMALALARMPEREQRLLRSHLRGDSWKDIADQEGLAAESARKAVQRALQLLRKFIHTRTGGDSSSL